MSEALERIDEAARRYGRGSATAQLRVSAPSTFAMRWLIPRLPAFHVRYPGSLVQVLSATTQQMSLAGSFDLAIRRTPPPSAHFSAQAFYEEWQTLVIAPALMRRLPLKTPADLAGHLLLETETRPGHWQQWLTTAGYIGGERLQRQRFDHFYVTLSAIVDGLGVGIGPMPTLEIDLRVGRLCAPFPDIRTDSRRYFALTPSGAQKTLLHRRFEDWLVEQGAAGTSEAPTG
jgi:DNA-binding transcriptional LysR family regulator